MVARISSSAAVRQCTATLQRFLLRRIVLRVSALIRTDGQRACLSEEDTAVERQGEYTESIVRRIRKRLDEELRKDNEFRSPYMMQALNYLDHFWDGLFLYRKDGSYPIDNNLAERSVRPFTTKRKSSLHFGSDEGVEMSAVYHSIISTLKLCGKSVWNFFGEYFRCEVLGLDTYKEYLPALSR